MRIKYIVEVDLPTIRNDEKRDYIMEEIRQSLEDDLPRWFYDEDGKEYNVSFSVSLVED